MYNSVYLVVFLTIFSTIQQGECNPKCYMCDSKSDPKCVHPEESKLDTRECMPNILAETKSVVEKVGLTKLANLFEIDVHKSDFSEALSCLKVISKVHESEVILRNCQYSPSGDLDFCKKLKEEGKNVILHCSLCSENGCNSANAKSISIGLMALLIPSMFAMALF